jgi:hypothetical protein
MLTVIGNKGRTWHINEPAPEIHGYSQEFFISGDELRFLLACMDNVAYDKVTGKLSLKAIPRSQNDEYDKSQGA